MNRVEIIATAFVSVMAFHFIRGMIIAIFPGGIFKHRNKDK